MELLIKNRAVTLSLNILFIFESQYFNQRKTTAKYLLLIRYFFPIKFIQSMGYYVQYIVQLGWHTDAFEQLGKSSEASYKRFVPEGFEPPDGPEDWIDAWTLFYWGWWISWSPFVGEKCSFKMFRIIPLKWLVLLFFVQ